MNSRSRRMAALAALVGGTLVIVAIAGLPRAAMRLLADQEFARELRAKWRGAQYVGDAGIVRQQKRNDCGAATLKMVFASHGIERDLGALELQLETRDRGTSLRNLRLVAESEGLHARSWKLTPKDLRKAPLPAIAFVNGDHFVVVRRFVDSDSLEVEDPALGRLHWPLEKFRSRWSGETLVFDRAWQPQRL